MTAGLLLHFPIYVSGVIIFVLIIVLNWFGFQFKKRRLRKYPGEVLEGMGSIEGAILGLMSLLLGFTFSLSVTKFETRRHLTVEEANIISMAIMRCDLYPDSIRKPLRADFKEYLETRIAYYKAGVDEEKVALNLRKGEEIAGRIWKSVAFYSNNLDFRVRSQQMIPALNDMVDIAVTRDGMRISNVPTLILWTLVVLVFVTAFLLGSDTKAKRRNKILVSGYAFVMTITLNLIFELNKPREGLINNDSMEVKMTDLRIMFEKD